MIFMSDFYFDMAKKSTEFFLGKFDFFNKKIRTLLIFNI